MAKRNLVISTSNFDLSNPLIGKLESEGWTIVRNPYGRRLTELEITELLVDSQAEAMIAGVEPLTSAVLDKNPQMKFISRCGIGMDSVDLDAATERGIEVTNTPDAPASAVAELTVGLMLSHCRRIAESDRSVRSGEWKQMMGVSLAGQSVGVVGLGRVGERVAVLVNAFGAQVSYYDPHVSTPAHRRYENIKDLAAASDILTLHVPLGDTTRFLVDEAVIAALPTHALLVNTSRGGIVDETALLAALQEGRIGGAALDVFETEPYEGPLVGAPGTTITAHMGSYARQTREIMETDAIRNLIESLRKASSSNPTADD